jgi:hypothetical protein
VYLIRALCAEIDQACWHRLLQLSYRVYSFFRSQRLPKHYLQQFNHLHIHRRLCYRFCRNTCLNKPFHRQLTSLGPKILLRYLQREFLALDVLRLRNLWVGGTLIVLRLKSLLCTKLRTKLVLHVLLIKQVYRSKSDLVDLGEILIPLR